jgi:ParB-like chromosome segregation protein Spo0J
MLTERPKLKVEWRPSGSLVPYVRNARTHTPEQIAQIAKSIEKFGWTNPILVDGEDGVIAGHGRLQAAKLLGMPEVPVIDLKGFTPARKRALVLADNQIALNAGWDTAALGVELSQIEAEIARDLSVSLGDLGFSDAEVSTAFQAASKP